MGCYMAKSGVLHDFGSYHESTWASGICGAHVYMSIPLQRHHNYRVLYIAQKLLYLVLLTWHVAYSGLYYKK
jgi:hypothetical protein